MRNVVSGSLHDSSGNVTKLPRPGAETTRLHFKYDAWNRPAVVYNDDNGSQGTERAVYRYDGQNHRVRKVDKTVESNVTYDFYYNEGWQILEVRKNESAGGLPEK